MPQEGSADRSEVYVFEAFTLDAAERVLLRDGRPIALTPKAFDLLLLFVRHPRRLLEKATLLNQVWPDAIVEEANLAFQVSALRRVLDEGRTGESVIQTVPTKGYRFASAVARIHPPEVSSPSGNLALEGRRVWRYVVLGGLALALATLIGALAAARWRRVQSSHEASATRLTASPANRPVRSSRISPDGRLLAYSDADGIHTQIIDSGETRLVPATEGLDVYAWTSDSSHVRAMACDERKCQGWDVPLLSGGTRFRNGAEWPAEEWISASPTGDQLVRVSSPEQIVTIDNLDGKPPKTVLAVNRDGVGSWTWSADSTHILGIPANGSRVDSVPVGGGAAVRVFTPAQGEFLDEVLQLPERRLLVSVRRVAPAVRSRTQWSVQEVPTDANGVAIGSPRLVIGWRDERLGPFSASANGRRVAVGTAVWKAHVYVAAFDPRVGLTTPPRRVTSGEWNETATAWAPDSRGPYLVSSRNDDADILEHPLGSVDPEPVIVRPGSQFRPEPTTDGKWLLFVDSDASFGQAPSADSRLMRIPLPRGRAERITTLQHFANPRCAFRGPCFLQEMQSYGVALFELDPIHGKGREVGRWPEGASGFCVLADGKSAALIREPPRNDTIRIASLTGGQTRDLRLPIHLAGGIDPLADGTGFLATARDGAEHTALVLVRLDGTTQTLWSDPNVSPEFALNSPNGKYVAITATAMHTDVLLLQP